MALNLYISKMHAYKYVQTLEKSVSSVSLHKLIKFTAGRGGAGEANLNLKRSCNFLIIPPRYQ